MASIQGSSLTWHHIKAVSLRDLDFVKHLYTVNPFDLEDCISQKQLPTVVDRKDYLFVILHFPRFIPEKKTVIPRQLGVFLSEKFLVTVYQSELRPVDQLFRTCETDPQTRQELLEECSGELLYRILDGLVDNLFPMLDKVLEAMENIEDDVFDDRVSVAREVHLIERDIVDQRRILFPLDKQVNEIHVKTRRYCKANLDLHYEDLHDRVSKVWDTLGSAQERVDIFNDTDFVLSTERTNKILAVLTIMFTLAIPATLIGTFMGMNVNLPGGVETGPWLFLGTYTTLILVLVASLVPAALMMWLFWRWRWL
jgi:magnesium transporter